MAERVLGLALSAHNLKLEVEVRDEFSGDRVTYKTFRRRVREDNIYDHNLISMALFFVVLMVMMLMGCTTSKTNSFLSLPHPVEVPDLRDGIVDKFIRSKL